MCVPRGITCEFEGDASISCEAIAGYDGTNDPFKITENQTLPAGLVDNEVFTIGTASVGGVTIDHLKGVDIDFGIEVAAVGADKDKWPTYVSIRSVNPTIRLRGVDIEWFKSSNIPLEGKAATHLNTSVILRKRLSGGDCVADATLQHVKFTMDGFAYIDDAAGASRNEPHELSLVIVGRKESTNDPLIVDTTSAI